ncbi:MAG TPA: phosphate/phosphite/phosphonate ABC transporter substrate-binding protein [bacterium]|nr:phosphate/phosphite/phosphonate ABC transporter substrate-binding protein [bacterium]
MKIKRIALALTMVMLAACITSCGIRRGELGSEKNPIRFFFMPLKGEEAFRTNSKLLTDYIRENTGLHAKAIHSPDFVTIVKAFGNGQADIAFTNTLGYLMARDWAKAEAHLLQLYGDVYRNYRGEIVARVDGPINAPTDLAGKSIAFADPFSASGYLYPLKFLKDRNIKPGSTSFAGSHVKAMEMVYDGKVDAAATFHTRPSVAGVERDARSEILAKHPDAMAKLKIVALTDEIPNGPVALRRGLPAEIKSKLVGSLMEFARTPGGRQALIDLYNITGLTIANDADYDGVQKVIKSVGLSVEEVVPGGLTFYMQKISPLLEY